MNIFGWDRERRELYERAKKPKGAHCDLCLRYIKVYKRKIGPKMARWLIGLVRRYENEEPRWYSVAEDWSKRIDSRENSKLDYWGMVIQRPKEKEQKGRTSGFWKPTDAGISFARRQCAVPKYKFIYKNKVILEVGPQVTIVDALADAFDYEQMMSEGLDE